MSDRRWQFFLGALLIGLSLGSLWLAHGRVFAPDIVWGGPFSVVFAVLLLVLAVKERAALVKAAWAAGAVYFAIHALAPATAMSLVLSMAVLLMEGALLVAATLRGSATSERIVGVCVCAGAAIVRVFTVRELGAVLAR